MVGPIDELGTEYDGKVVVGKVMWMQTKNLQQNMV
jgi:hypothetical protein